MPFPIDEKYIFEAEQELGLSFPGMFKAKMKKENGGVIETENDDWQLFPFFDKLDKKRISRTSNHIILETKEAKKWRNFPNNGIAIGENGSGDRLILLPTIENSKVLSEEIYTWFHETGEVEKIADSIEEFDFI